MRMHRRAAIAGAAAVAAAATTLTLTGGTAYANPPRYVDGSGHLHCGNDAPTAIYQRAMYGTNSPIVDHLRSNPSWFKCYVTGAYTGGGNYIWYYTYGDDTGTWGYVPAVHVWTSNDPPNNMDHC